MYIFFISAHRASSSPQSNCKSSAALTHFSDILEQDFESILFYFTEWLGLDYYYNSTYDIGLIR